jgi:hypothetical protein
MLSNLPLSPAGYGAIAELRSIQPALHAPRLLYLALAAVLLVIALRFVRRALAPIGALVQAVAAAAVVAFATGLALILVVAAALSGH